ncbi:hypothetical protein HHI36_020381 [Cryptolaemus montrouzieri]|uniref:Uncharacterized protein n=1 Tax=Cryptolaemus montrouzieri TaxID=559131 RepID=A0ABD2NA89_9CUCU
MSGVVFMVCVPTEAKENHLYSSHGKRLGKSHSDVDFDSKQGSTSSSEFQDSHRSNTQKKLRKIRKTTSSQLIPMSRILEDILETFGITNAVWYRGEGDYVQVVFPLESQEQCEAILHKLNSNNIGRLYDSSVSVLPCSVHYNGHINYNKSESSEVEQGATESNENPWNKIVSSKNTRLTVDQIVETVKNRAALTFDFICLILISTTMCALGLVENSTVYLLSSMVMSPMMGPVMAATFGSVIRDSRLQKVGVRNELLGLFIAMMVGFCYGAITCIITDKYGSQEWPTYEMTSRGELRSLWLGCIIALISGTAVALGILSDNFASLVGVAISTSLMPPAVNAGLLWSMATVYYFKGNSTTRYKSLDYQRHYSSNDTIELLSLGAVSICLTLVNIVCIYFAAICIFKVKEVAPIASLDEERRQFWKYDIKNARYNNTLQGEESRRVRSEYEDIKFKSHPKTATSFLHHSADFSKDNSKIRMNRNQSTWSHSTMNRPTEAQRKDPKAKSNARRLSSIFKEGFLEHIKDGIVSKKLEALREKEQLSDSSEESQSLKVHRESKLVYTKSKTFVVTTCEGLPKPS